jgi:hypothetical protein
MSVDSRPDFLSALPDEPVGIITDYVDPVSIINLDLTARRYHAFFNQNAFTKLKLPRLWPIKRPLKADLTSFPIVLA